MTSSNTTTTANANNPSSSSSSSSSSLSLSLSTSTSTSTSSSRKRPRDNANANANANANNEKEEEETTATRMNPTAATTTTTTTTTELLPTTADTDDKAYGTTNAAANGKEKEAANLTNSDSDSDSDSDSVVTGLRLEAIFHPKFDNERNKNKGGGGSGSGSGSGDGGDDIRRTMLQRLPGCNSNAGTNTESTAGNANAGRSGGYLEVSLKHSGSLVLWSGSTRYYSKNSSCNEFTRVAEILLRQYFVATTSSTSSLYEECSNCVEQNRYTIAFEVVTGLLGLGDHGQIPKKDYVVVTAIADRRHEKFLSTSQVLEFCQTYKLPHNDIWTFSSSLSAEKLFNLYDNTLKEIGYTQNTVEALTTISEVYIPSPVPHLTYQGTICEGFIVRYVENNNNNIVNENNNINNGVSSQQSQRMEKLAQTARDILKEISTCTESKRIIDDPVLTTDLRDLYRSTSSIPHYDNDNDGDGNKSSTTAGTLQRRRTELFSEELRKLLLLSPSSSKEERHDLKKIEVDKQRENNNTTIINNFHLPSLTKCLLEKAQQQQQQDGNDKETTRIATLLQTLDGIKNAIVSYTWLEKQNKLYCMIHVHNDPTFFKYQKITEQQPNNNDMTLFRGFCVEVVLSSPSSSSKGNSDSDEFDNDDNHPSSSNNETVADVADYTAADAASTTTAPPLMLKMKLLPYMVRTFICRNLLKVIEQKGPEEFERIASGLLEKWGISNKSQEHWMSFFRGWAIYVLRYNTNINNDDIDDNVIHLDLGPLTNFSYLNHLEYYTKLYEDGKFQTVTTTSSDSIAASPETNTFVCVISQSTEVALAIANHFANLFNNSNSDNNEKTMNEIKMSVFSLGEATKYNRTKNCVVYANVTDLTKGIKKFICKKVPKHSILVLYGSDPDDMTITEIETPNTTTVTTTDQQEADGSAPSLSTPSSSTPSSWLDISSNGERKKLVNMWKSWKKFPCAKRIALSRSVVEFEPKLKDSIAAVITRTATEELEETVVDEIRDVGRSLIEQEAKKQSKPSTHGGILLFFPGIPGCGKSSLLQQMEGCLQEEITSRKKEKDDLYDRNVYVKEGDTMGKNFWDVICNILSDDGDSDPAALVIADKNAPPASWPRIGQTCNDSNSIPLPVLPDSTVLETTTIEGTIQPDGVFLPHSSHFYPFSLKFLSVSLSRVLSRPPGEHSGKLDSGSPVACMVVVQFYSFYRYISADTFIEKLDGKLESKAKALKPIELPFLVASNNQDHLPGELKTLLIEALQLRHGHDKNKKYKVKKDDPQMIDMEARLRQCIEMHQETIQAMTVSLKDTQKAFKQQVVDRINSLSAKTDAAMMDSSTTKEEDIVKSIKLFSLDIDRTAVHDLLQKHHHESGLLKHFFDSIISSSSSSSPPESQPPNFIVNPHVTMAFAGEKNPAETLISTFRHLQGREVLVTVTGFLWSLTHAAFAINIALSTIGLKSDGAEDSVSIPSCENSFPHITVWCAPETKAFHSNELPDLVQSGKAFRIDFDEPLMTLIGKFSFWNHTNEVISI